MFYIYRMVIRMMMNLKLTGVTETVLKEVVKQGIASNKSEAIRLMILHYNDHYEITPIGKRREAEALVRKIDAMDAEVASGKKRWLTSKEALGKYAKYLE
jgi:hypothetical protein